MSYLAWAAGILGDFVLCYLSWRYLLKPAIIKIVRAELNRPGAA